MSNITTIILAIIGSTVLSTPIGVWLGSMLTSDKYRAKIDQLRVEVSSKLSSVKSSELDNVRKANDLLVESIVTPLQKEISSLRRNVDKFRKAIEKSLFALMLTSALCLASCRVTRETTTTARAQYNATMAATADSVGTSAIATQTMIKAQVDSLLQAALMQATEHQSEASVEQTLHLLLFDTTQPADTATGLPPVKAALTKTTAAKRKDNTERKAQADVKAELKRAQTDSTQTLAQSTAHVQSDQQANVAAKSK